jgi:hypothetical protein
MMVCLMYFFCTSGCYQWKFVIVKENKGNEGTCVGVARFPIKDYSHRTTTDMWLYRAYRYDENMFLATSYLLSVLTLHSCKCSRILF